MSPENNQNENNKEVEPVERVDSLDNTKIETQEIKVEEPKIETLKDVEEEETTADFEDTDDDLSNSEEELNLWEKILEFEGTTKVGILCTLILLFGVLFANWLDYTWWVVLILTGVAVRNLYKQKIDLEDEKPFEARIAAAFLYGVVGILILRDLLITIKLHNIYKVADLSNIREIITFF